MRGMEKPRIGARCRGARGRAELVAVFCVSGVVHEAADYDGFRDAIDRNGLLAHVHVDVEAAAGAFAEVWSASLLRSAMVPPA